MVPSRHRWLLLLGLAGSLLLQTSCEQPDYSGASFKPVEGAPTSARLVLHLFEPAARSVPWGDASLYHRRSPAARDAAPVGFEAGLIPGERRASGSDGLLDLQVVPGSYGLEVLFGGRRILDRLELGSDELHVALWSVEGPSRVFGLRAAFPRTELLSGPMAELAALLPSLRDHLTSLTRALEEGSAEDLERILAEDFRDPLGGRVDFLRAALHLRHADRPLRVIGDAWFVREGTSLRLHLIFESAGRRTFPTLELVEDRRGPGGYRIRTLY